MSPPAKITKRQAVKAVADAVARLDVERPAFEHLWEEIGTQVYVALRRDPRLIEAVNERLTNEDIAEVVLAALARKQPDLTEFIADHIKHSFYFHTDRATRRRR